MADPSLPQFTGFEPCATTDPDLFYPDKGMRGGISSKRVTALCQGCLPATFTACREWGIHRERHGIWGGMTATDRKAERTRLGIRLDDDNDESRHPAA